MDRRVSAFVVLSRFSSGALRFSEDVSATGERLGGFFFDFEVPFVFRVSFFLEETSDVLGKIVKSLEPLHSGSAVNYSLERTSGLLGKAVKSSGSLQSDPAANSLLEETSGVLGKAVESTVSLHSDSAANFWLDETSVRLDLMARRRLACMLLVFTVSRRLRF